VRIKNLGLVEYRATWCAMRDFCDVRTNDTEDELWLLEHPPTYTLGQAGRAEHVLRDNGIPLVRCDRGGQVTYHAPGQIVVYLLLNLRRRRLGLRELVRRLEKAVIVLLSDYGISACGDVTAPGVYVSGSKIAALGLRLRHGCTYHGMSLNVNMDLAPFADINPCGFVDLPVTQLIDLNVTDKMPQVREKLVQQLCRQLGADGPHVTSV
jgi:lipoyl(octanoyl) transferase